MTEGTERGGAAEDARELREHEQEAAERDPAERTPEAAEEEGGRPVTPPREGTGGNLADTDAGVN